MSDSSENLDTGLRAVFESLFATKHFCMPASVTAFDSAQQTVSVQPALKTLFQNETTAKLLPVIEDVPVIYPGGGTFFVTFDILVGSFVLLVFAERSIENFMNMGQIADPQSVRKCDLSDAIAIPGILPMPNILVPGVDATALTIRNKLKTSYVTVKDTEIEVTSGSNTVKVGPASVDVNGSADFAVAYNDLKIAFDQLKNDFNNFVNVTYNLHNHPTAPPGPVSTPAPIGTSSTADMTAAKVATVKLP